MANANKAKGDRAEAAVRDYIQEWFPESWRTRAGWDEDRGDIVLDLLGDKAMTWAVQVKDVASPAWTEWFRQVASQIKAGGHRGGVIWWKLRGKGHPKDWRVVMSGEQYMQLMHHVRDLENHLDGVYPHGT